MFNGDSKITHVAIIVVVEAEIEPILAELGFTLDVEATRDFMDLAVVRSGVYRAAGGSFKLSVLKVAESRIFGRHYSGYTQASAVAALAAKVLAPSLVISFGVRPPRIPSLCTRSTREGIEWCCCHRAVCMARPR